MSNMNDFVIENGVLKRYLGPDGDVEIPGGVTCIGFQAFLACRTYKGYGPMKVTIPDGVTSVGRYAFESCTQLKSVTIPGSLERIGGDAFWSCSRIQELHLSDLAAWCGISFEDDDANPGRYARRFFLNGEEIQLFASRMALEVSATIRFPGGF